MCTGPLFYKNSAITARISAGAIELNLYSETHTEVMNNYLYGGENQLIVMRYASFSYRLAAAAAATATAEAAAEQS